MTPEEREELLAAYALGTLSGPEATLVEDLVRGDAAAAADLASYHELVDMIALSVPLRRADPSLRGRLMDVARRESRRRRERPPYYRLVPWGVVAASIMLVAVWGLNVHRDLGDLREHNLALTSIVEADAKRLDALAGDAPGQSPEALRLQLQEALADQQLTLAVTADPEARSSVLQPTASGHGAGGRYLWSQGVQAGVIVTRNMPPLPLGSVYQVWLEKATTHVPGGTFVPDLHGNAEVVVRPNEEITPGRILIAVAPVGGSADLGRQIVLVGLLNQ